jgi:hypothetical protein
MQQENALAPTNAPPRAVRVIPSRETWPMQDQFYTSQFPEDDTSTTIIFNLFKGPADALRIQLEAAVSQQDVVAPEIWVMCFNSPLQREYEAVVNSIRAKSQNDLKIVLTISDFNHKFHGRFLLASMATTKYVLIVDDDKNVDATTVRDYIACMKVRKGVWGNGGHRRASDFEGYKFWPGVGFDLTKDDYAEVDYLSGMWFLEQSWLEYFVKERMPSWATAEDMHLSHVMRKYLNLNTYGGKVALNLADLPKKQFAATKGSALDLREYIFDHQLGRGNKVANVDQPIDTLVYAETVDDIEDFMLKLEECGSRATPSSFRVSTELSPPWCRGGKTAAVFRGGKEQDVVGLIAAAERLCAKTQCEYLSVKPKIKHPIRYFNMREGFGQDDVEIPWQTSASDVLMSFVGVLGNVQPKQIFLPDVNGLRWVEDAPAARTPTKMNRLQVYHETARLAVLIYKSSPINQKWDHRANANVAETAYPKDLRVHVWQHS